MKETSTNEYTLLDVMHRVMAASFNSHLDRALYNYDNKVNSELEYLTSRLSLTETEAVLFSLICEKGAHRRVHLFDLGSHLRCDNLQMLQHKSSIASLVQRGLVVEEPVNKYFVPDEVLQALSRNETWTDEVHLHPSDSNLYHDLFEHFSLASSNRISKSTLYPWVFRLLDANAHHHFARVLEPYRATLDEDEFLFLLAISCLWLVKGYPCAPFTRMASVLRNATSVTKLQANLLNGSSRLLTDDIIKPHSSGSIADEQEYALTSNTMHQLKPELSTDLSEDDDLLPTPRQWAEKSDLPEIHSSLLSPGEIAKRQLFYNDATAHQVDELATLLSEENMRSVLARLKSSNLRCSFCCLFHGGPGTGKTETVLQLARRTGRGVFQVEVSELRSKWHGESERLVKQVFNSYRKLVAQSSLTPIMLFNEADAIFNHRMENPEHSADKCENALQNIILQEMETLDGILIATTNLAGNLDPAFERRFLYKIAFETPDSITRSKIWLSMMPSLDGSDALKLAESFPDLAGGHIENISRKATISLVLHGSPPNWDDLTEMCRQESLAPHSTQIKGFRPQGCLIPG